MNEATFYKNQNYSPNGMAGAPIGNGVDDIFFQINMEDLLN